MPKYAGPAATESDVEVQLLVALILRGGIGVMIRDERSFPVNIGEVEIFRRLPGVNLKGWLRARRGDRAELLVQQGHPETSEHFRRYRRV